MQLIFLNDSFQRSFINNKNNNKKVQNPHHERGSTFLTYWRGFVGCWVYAVDSTLRNGVFILSLLSCTAPTDGDAGMPHGFRPVFKADRCF